ncbi:hypothetical protein BU15DRAFT_63611 [Melanogaster broomeanus]|nr:hypothetical protein BU15DRAFT_63611 [Melanogaster broomeanus]
MSITAGYHKIKTSSGKYLTLLSQTGNVTAQTSNGATNQTWDVQPAGSSTYTIRNTGYDTSTYAYSAGQNGSAVTGSTSSLEWSIVTSNGNYFFLPGSDNSLAWNVQDDGSVKLNGKQLTNSGQQFTIDNWAMSLQRAHQTFSTPRLAWTRLNKGANKSNTLLGVPGLGVPNTIVFFARRKLKLRSLFSL